MGVNKRIGHLLRAQQPEFRGFLGRGTATLYKEEWQLEHSIPGVQSERAVVRESPMTLADGIGAMGTRELLPSAQDMG